MSLAATDQCQMPLRLQIVVGVIVVLALFQDVRLVRNSINAAAVPDHRLRTYEQRFAAAKHELAHQKIVGYLTDQPSSRDYFLAVYAMAPIILDRNDRHEWMVVHTTHATTKPIRPFNEEYQLVKDFGNGVALFRKILP